MSFDLNLTAHKAHLNPEAWVAEIRKHLPGFEFETGIDWMQHSGWTPCTWNDPDEPGEVISAGFEFLPEWKKRGLFGGKYDLNALFSCSGEEDEYRALRIAAAALAIQLDGTLTDPQSGESLKGSKAMDAALEALKPRPQPEVKNSYNTVDFAALKSFHKENITDVHKLARELLGELGMKRHKRTASYHDDQGWYLIFASFLPGKSTWMVQIDVAACLLWTQDEYISFSICAAHEDPKFESPEALRAANRGLVEQAVQRVLDLRRVMESLSSAREALEATLNCYEPHKSSLVAVLHGLSGDFEAMKARLVSVLQSDDQAPDWRKALSQEANELLNAATSRDAFRDHVLSLIRSGRALRGLPEREVTLPDDSTAVSPPAY